MDKIILRQLSRAEDNNIETKAAPLRAAELDGNFLYLYDRIVNVDSSIATNSTSIATLSNNLAALSDRVTNLENRVTVLEDIVDPEILNRVVALEVRVDDHEDRITNNETTLVTHDDRISTNESTLVAHDGRISTNESTLTDHESRITTLESFHAGDAPVVPVIPFITVSASSNTANETDNKTITFTVTSRNFQATDNITYSIGGTNITANDFITELSGIVHQGNNVTEFVVEVKKDTETESVSEIMDFSVTSDSTDPLFTPPLKKSVTILDSSFNSVLKTLAYTCTGDFFTWGKSNTLNTWATNFDISQLLITTSEKQSLVSTAISTISRTGLINYGLTNQQIDDVVELIIEAGATETNTQLQTRFPSNADTVVFEDYEYDLFGNHGGFVTIGNDQWDPDLETWTITDVNRSRTFARAGEACLGVVYKEEFTSAEIEQAVDVVKLTDPNWNNYPAELQTALRQFMIEILTIVYDFYKTKTMPVDLYHYEILNQIP